MHLIVGSFMEIVSQCNLEDDRWGDELMTIAHLALKKMNKINKFQTVN